MNGPIVIAGGGTGGHVFVAAALAEGLEAQGVTKDNLRFIGSERGQEKNLLSESGISLDLLPGRGIQRSLSFRALRDNLGSVLGIARAFLRSLRLIATLKPAAVVSVGGYAAAPVGLAAVVFRRPLILVNIDAVPGLTHTMLGHFATASCVAVGGTGLRNEVVTGIPVRAEFANLDRSAAARRAARVALGCDPDRTFLAVVTGSLGARSVNQAVSGVAGLTEGFSGTIFHVTGRRDAEEMTRSKPAERPGGPDYRLVAFEDRMALLYQAADLALTRAGALTVGELALCGVAGILVPLPGAPGDHQTKNAQALVAHNAAVMIKDSELSASRLNDVLLSLAADASARGHMEAAARALSHPEAAREVSEVVLAHAR